MGRMAGGFSGSSGRWSLDDTGCDSVTGVPSWRYHGMCCVGPEGFSLDAGVYDSGEFDGGMSDRRQNAEEKARFFVRL